MIEAHFDENVTIKTVEECKSLTRVILLEMLFCFHLIVWNLAKINDNSPPINSNNPI